MSVALRRRLHTAVSSVTRGRARRRVVVASVGAAAVMFAATAAPAGAFAFSSPESLTVMSRNLYLGADLTPALTATDTTSFLTAVAKIYGTARYTDFATRAEGLADEIKANKPDLIGLQEVSSWETSGPGVPASQDFLAVLQAALTARGLSYTAVSVSNNADIGPMPLVSPCDSDVVGACLVTLRDRDVILANTGNRRLSTSDAKHGTYTHQQTFTPPVPGASAISFERGWATVEARIGRESFHFATTHLETEDFPTVQQAQAAEFLAGPARSSRPTVVVGDFNSAADGSTTTSYASLTRVFLDAWRTQRTAGLSCCESETLTNPTPQLTTRIDLALGRLGAFPVTAKLVGATPFRTAPPLYASDHAGLVAKFLII